MTNEPDSSNDERWAAARRRHNLLTGTCVVLAVVIAGLVWYAYPTLHAEASLHNLPSVTQRLKGAVDTIGDRVRESEAKAAESVRAQQSLRGQVTDLGRNLRARIECREQAGDANRPRRPTTSSRRKLKPKCRPRPRGWRR